MADALFSTKVWMFFSPMGLRRNSVNPHCCSDPRMLFPRDQVQRGVGVGSGDVATSLWRVLHCFYTCIPHSKLRRSRSDSDVAARYDAYRVTSFRTCALYQGHHQHPSAPFLCGLPLWSHAVSSSLTADLGNLASWQLWHLNLWLLDFACLT